MSVLDRLEALLAQASDRPWFVIGPPWNEGAPWINARSGDPHGGDFVCDFVFMDDEEGPAEAIRSTENAALICGAVNALPDLIACARALGETRDELEARVDCQGTEQNPCPDETGWPCWWCSRLTLIDQALARLAEGEPQP